MHSGRLRGVQRMASQAAPQTRCVYFMSRRSSKLIYLSDIAGGTLSHVVPLHVSSLLFLVGGGRSPRYPPNKVIFWDDALGKEVAELEFRERVRGLACRRGWLAVALRRRVVVFQIDETIGRYAEWDTCDNPRGMFLVITCYIPRSDFIWAVQVFLL